MLKVKCYGGLLCEKFNDKVWKLKPVPRLDLLSGGNDLLNPDAANIMFL